LRIRSEKFKSRSEYWRKRRKYKSWCL